MSTNDVPGAVLGHADVLAMGCWAEAADPDDDSYIFVESTEVGRVVFCVFDMNQVPPVEYRDAMPEVGFKEMFSWKPGVDDDDNVRWTWHDKTPFPWDLIMGTFPAGSKHVSAEHQLTAAQRVARTLDLQAEKIRARDVQKPTLQRAANTIMTGIKEAIGALRP